MKQPLFYVMHHNENRHVIAIMSETETELIYYPQIIKKEIDSFTNDYKNTLINCPAIELQTCDKDLLATALKFGTADITTDRIAAIRHILNIPTKAIREYNSECG